MRPTAADVVVGLVLFREACVGQCQVGCAVAVGFESVGHRGFWIFAGVWKRGMEAEGMDEAAFWAELNDFPNDHFKFGAAVGDDAAFTWFNRSRRAEVVSPDEFGINQCFPDC